MDTEKPLMSLCASDLMSPEVLLIPREMSLKGAARMLARAGVTGAPVVDASGRCIGVLSATDYMRWVESERKAPLPQESAECMCKPWQIPEGVLEEAGCVERCMTRDPVLVGPNTRIGDLARMMMDAHIHRLIVVDRSSQRPIGIVSSTDVLAAVARAEMSMAEPSEETLY